MNNRSKGLLLSAAFVFALIMGPGPGLLLVNRPVAFCGIPLLYAWGLLWYGVEVAVVATAFVWLWSKTDEEEEATETSDPNEAQRGAPQK